MTNTHGFLKTTGPKTIYFDYKTCSYVTRSSAGVDTIDAQEILILDVTSGVKRGYQVMETDVNGRYLAKSDEAYADWNDADFEIPEAAAASLAVVESASLLLTSQGGEEYRLVLNDKGGLRAVVFLVEDVIKYRERYTTKTGQKLPNKLYVQLEVSSREYEGKTYSRPKFKIIKAVFDNKPETSKSRTNTSKSKLRDYKL